MASEILPRGQLSGFHQVPPRQCGSPDHHETDVSFRGKPTHRGHISDRSTESESESGR